MTSATVRLIEGVRLIRCPLNTGFTVLSVTSALDRRRLLQECVMFHHPGVLILLRSKKTQSVGCPVVRLPGNSIVRCSSYAPELLERSFSNFRFSERKHRVKHGVKYIKVD